MTMEAEIGVMQPRGAWGYQKLGEARRGTPLEPLESAWLC
jgi:hypothetical protein